METMSIMKIKEELARGWGDEPTIETCFAIIDYMERRSPSELQMLTFTSLRHAANKETIDSELLNAITILVSSKVAALDAHAMLVDDDHTEHEISLEYLNSARSVGELIHPETGLPVRDFESKIFPFFAPSANFRSA